MNKQATNATFMSLLEQKWRERKFVCVGLDPVLELIPDFMKEKAPIQNTFYAFTRTIIEATHDLVCAYKPNSAFYEAYGEAGMEALIKIVEHIKSKHPDIPVILDAKRADIDNTNRGYVEAAFDIICADAITVHPYLGKEAMKPFLARRDKGIIVLVKTSNAGSDELQNLPVGEHQEPLYQVVARNVTTNWNTNGNCAIVVGATYPNELRQVRAIVGDMPILIPGIGAQGGDIQATVQAGKDSRGRGMIINSSRGILYASHGSDFVEAARNATQKLHDAINNFL